MPKNEFDGLPVTDADEIDPFLDAALDEAREGLREGGIPTGSVLVIDGRIVGRGHNRRVQQGSAVLHAEMDCLERAGRLRAADYARATLYSNALALRHVQRGDPAVSHPRVVIGENTHYRGPAEEYLRSRGVELDV